MKKQLFIIMSIVLLFVLSACSGSKSANSDNPVDSNSKEDLPVDENGNKIVTLKVFTRDASAPTRVTNFEGAAKKMNTDLEEAGEDYRVQVEAIVKPMDGEAFDQNFIFASQSGNAADIYATSYTSVGWMADGGYIKELNGIEKEEVFTNLMDGYWNPVKWDGNIYGVIQDTEARVVYFNKNRLRELGWTEAEINELPAKAESGDFLLSDMITVAKEAQEKGIVDKGYEFDGGSNDNPMNFYNFGAEIYDWDKGQFILDKANVLSTFEWMKESVDSGVIPAENITTDKNEKLARLVNNETLFIQAGIWDEAKFRKNGLHKEQGNLTTDWIKENLGVMNLPVVEKGNKPITVSNPWVYVVSKDTKQFDAAKKLLAYVSEPEFQAKHGVETSHIPFTKEGQEHETVVANEWINSVKHFTNYSKFNGNHPDQAKYDKIIKDASSYVMTGEMTPQEAVDYMEEQLKLNIDEKNIQVK
ncbi:sugar ABC transporter substrate-binding protein [Bacillus sp. FJAT-42315]|uniref:sugar ABC transporter substrate-binding protein n=1 Tax=Bacillus sp. FJAT-42315 TaxID=2014077 RepID=UPI000C240ADB|nr:extracellular solute-binding protein [Bacillus sp. FJAT-42315]